MKKNYFLYLVTLVSLFYNCNAVPPGTPICLYKCTRTGTEMMDNYKEKCDNTTTVSKLATAPPAITCDFAGKKFNGQIQPNNLMCILENTNRCTIKE